MATRLFGTKNGSGPFAKRASRPNVTILGIDKGVYRRLQNYRETFTPRVSMKALVEWVLTEHMDGVEQQTGKEFIS